MSVREAASSSTTMQRMGGVTEPMENKSENGRPSRATGKESKNQATPTGEGAARLVP
jgi:hypothetical protein